MRPVGVLGTLAVLLASAAPAGAEMLVGLSGGIAIPGQQDLKFEERSPDGTSLRSVTTADVDETVGPIVGAAVTLWGDQGLLRHLALQFEAIYWHVDAKAASPSSAPSFTIGQDRTAIFLSVLGRLPVFPSLGHFSSEPGSDTFAYAGVGAGPAYTAVDRGDDGWKTGFQVLAGVAVPLTSRLQLRVETRYLLTSDADSSPAPGWRVDTSGTPDAPFRFNRHLDTRFFPVLLGLDWRF